MKRSTSNNEKAPQKRNLRLKIKNFFSFKSKSRKQFEIITFIIFILLTLIIGIVLSVKYDTTDKEIQKLEKELYYAEGLLFLAELPPEQKQAIIDSAPHDDNLLEMIKLAVNGQKSQYDLLKAELLENGYSETELNKAEKTVKVLSNKVEIAESNLSVARFTASHPFISNTFSPVVNLVGGASSAVDITTQCIVNSMAGNDAPIDFFTNYHALSQGSKAIRDTTVRMIELDTEDNLVGAATFTYDSLMTSLDGSVASLIPGGFVLFGLAAANDAMIIAQENEASDAEVLIAGIFGYHMKES